MTTNPMILLTSKSSIETDWSCGMKYWWHKLEGGNGIRPVVEENYFVEGRELHADLEPYARGAGVDEVVELLPKIESVAPDQLALEKLARRIGWVVAFGHWIEPILRLDSEEVTCEDRIVLERDPLWVECRPDRVQRGKGAGLRYREWKSTATTRQEWVQSWAFSPQLHLGLAALEEELKEKVDFASVLGFYKGFEKGGKLLHPYTWAYRSPQGTWSPSYTYGWEKVGVWEYPGGVREWVEKCGPTVAQECFIWSAPCFKDDRVVESLVRARTARMIEIEAVKELAQHDDSIRETHFEQRFNECRPPYGSACQFLAACHNASVHANPTGSGIYLHRDPSKGDE